MLENEYDLTTKNKIFYHPSLSISKDAINTVLGVAYITENGGAR